MYLINMSVTVTLQGTTTSISFVKVSLDFNQPVPVDQEYVTTQINLALRMSFSHTSGENSEVT